MRLKSYYKSGPLAFAVWVYYIGNVYKTMRYISSRRKKKMDSRCFFPGELLRHLWAEHFILGQMPRAA